MEKRGTIYELQDVSIFSRDNVAHVSTFDVAKRSQPLSIDPHSDDGERQVDAKTRERLALEIYVQASLAREWLKQNDGARRLAARSQQSRLIRANAGWISAVAVTIGAFLAGVSIFLH